MIAGFSLPQWGKHRQRRERRARYLFQNRPLPTDQNVGHSLPIFTTSPFRPIPGTCPILFHFVPIRVPKKTSCIVKQMPGDLVVAGHLCFQLFRLFRLLCRW